MSKCPVDHTAMRKDLAPLPHRMKSLPIDDRGYPVPWFVDWMEVDGRRIPEFRSMDLQKWKRAVKERLCWVCGGPLGVHLSFVAGPMCGISRTSSEPPSHLDCARYSAQNCPFLNTPKMVRREDELINNEQLRENAAGFAICRNPGVAMIWNCRSYEVFKVPSTAGGSGYLITMGIPESVEWYAEGRNATREEVEESITAGLPSLVAIAQTETGGIEALQEYVRRFEKYLPQEKS